MVGVSGVELHGRNQLRPADLTRTAVRHLLKLVSDRNLRVCSYAYPTRHPLYEVEGLDRRLDAIRQAMSSAYELGARILAGSNLSLPAVESDSYSVLLQALTDLAVHAQKVGCWYAIRPCDADANELAGLMEQLPPGVVIDFDPAALVLHNQSPEEALGKVAEHVRHFRARDAVRDLSRQQGIEVQLGRGSIEFPQLLGRLEEVNYDGYFVIDRESATDPVLECHQAVEYLQSFF